MNFIDKAIVSVFPNYGMRRIVNLRRADRLEQLAPKKRSFDAVGGGRLRHDFLAPHNSPTNAVNSSAESLRNHVRQLEYNNGFVSGPIHRIANHVVSTGFNFQSRVKADDRGMDPKINQTMADSWNIGAELYFGRWAKQSDKRLIQTFSEQCHTAEMALLRDGAILGVGRNSQRRGRLIPYCLELLEIDRMRTPFSEINNPRIRNGIEFDLEGVPKTIYALRVHPGESIIPAGTKSDDFEEIPVFNPNGTRKVLHLYNPLRPEQEIGFSQFASALKDIQDLDRYTEAEKYAALEDACLTGIVTSPAAQSFQATYTNFDVKDNEDEGTTQRGHEFAPGKWNYLNPGEDITVHSPKRPNDAFGEMIDQLLRGPSNALDIPPEIVSQKWADMNYSNARTVLMMFDIAKIVRQAYLIDHLCGVVWENVANDFVVHGILQAPGFDRRKDDYLNHIWIPPGRDYIDPVKEAKGKETELNVGTETYQRVWAAKGGDWEARLEDRFVYEKKKADLAEQYGVELPADKEAVTEEPETPEPEDRTLRAVK